MTTYIYARISTDEQNVNQQANALHMKYPEAEDPIKEIFTGTTTDRPKFQKLLSKLERNDRLIVQDASRLGRSTVEVLQVAKNLKAKGVTLTIDSVRGLDFATDTGEMVLTMLAGLAQMERQQLLERQRIGIERAKADGKYKGRKATNEKVIATARKLLAEGMTKEDVAKQLNIGVSTLYRLIKK